MTVSYSKSHNSKSYPTITFKVNTLDMRYFFGNLPPDENINNLLYQLRNATIWVQHVDKALKHGDVFTLHGSEAIRVKETYERQTPQVVEIYSIPDVSDLQLNIDSLNVEISWTGNEQYFTEISINNNDEITYQIIEKGISSTVISVDAGSLQIKTRFTDNAGYYSDQYSIADTDINTVSPIPLVKEFELFSWGKTVWITWKPNQYYYTEIAINEDETWIPAHEGLLPEGTYEI